MGFLSLTRLAARFLRETCGNFAVIAATCTPFLAALVAGGLDLASYMRHRESLQTLADSAALAAASEATLQGWSQARAEEIVATFMAQARDRLSSGGAEVVESVIVDSKSGTVSVTIDQDNFGYFVAGYFRSDPQIRVQSVARAGGKRNVCVIALDPGASGALSLNDSAKLSAGDCAVFSNSASTISISATKSSVLTTDYACSAGGYAGASTNYSVIPVTDCPPLPDPLAARPAPSVSTACKATNLTVTGTGVTLAPGVYCGGLTIMDEAKVTFSPGIYIMRGGPLLIGSNSDARGAGVGFYFTGSNAYYDFTSNSTVDFSAPASGSMAGLLFFQDRNSVEQTFRIKSKKASNLLGTIYLPNGVFEVDTNTPVAETSAYTAIVAKRLSLRSKPDLVLNTNYGATAVPVPAGLGPVGDQPRLMN